MEHLLPIDGASSVSRQDRFAGVMLSASTSITHRYRTAPVLMAGITQGAGLTPVSRDAGVLALSGWSVLCSWSVLCRENGLGPERGACKGARRAAIQGL